MADDPDSIHTDGPGTLPAGDPARGCRRLPGKVVLLTGAARGIGCAIAQGRDFFRFRRARA